MFKFLLGFVVRLGFSGIYLGLGLDCDFNNWT